MIRSVTIIAIRVYIGDKAIVTTEGVTIIAIIKIINILFNILFNLIISLLFISERNKSQRKLFPSRVIVKFY
jgi:hypothetical protein